MITEENDPDTLQLRDELDFKWVKLWRNAAEKGNCAETLTFGVLQPEKVIQEKARRF